MVGMEDRLEALERKLNQTFRMGKVVATQPDKGTVKVELIETPGLISKPLQVLFPRTANNSSYDMPDVGEQVFCIFLPNGLEQGFVLGSPYSLVDSVPVANQDKKHYAFRDGSTMEYDRASHHLDINVVGTVTIHSEGKMILESGTAITLTAPKLNLN